MNKQSDSRTTDPLNDTQLFGLIDTITHCHQLTHITDVPYARCTLIAEGWVLLTLDYLSENRLEQSLAKTDRISQPTAFRTISTFTDLIATQLEKHRPTPADFQTFAGTLVVDGTLVTFWEWNDHDQLYSGKHQTTGLNPQVACDLGGTPDAGFRPEARVLVRPAVHPGIRIPRPRRAVLERHRRQWLHRVELHAPYPEAEKPSAWQREQRLQPTRSTVTERSSRE